MEKLLYLFALYLPFQIALNPTPGIDLASIRVFSILLFLVWLVNKIKLHCRSERSEEPNPRSIDPSLSLRMTQLIITFLLLSAFSLFFAQNIFWGARKLAFLLSFLPLYFVFRDAGYMTRYKTIICLIWSGTALAAIGIIQFALQFIVGLDGVYPFWKQKVLPIFLGDTFSKTVADYPSFLVNISSENIFRATGIFPDPHMFSMFLGMIFPLALFESFNKRKYYIAAFLILIAVLLSFSRASYVSILLGILIAVALTINKNSFSKPRLALISTTIFLLVFYIFVPFTANRFASTFNPEEGSNKARIETWAKSATTGMKNFLFGVGLGNYPLSVKPDADYREPIYSHNLYLDILAETGVVNMIIFVSLIYLAIKKYWTRFRLDSFYLAPILSLLIFLIQSFFETALFSVHILPLFIILIAFSNSRDQLSS